MTTRSGGAPDLADMLRRLRARPASSWQHGDRERSMRGALQRLADLTADASGEPRRVVPDVGPAALADQLAVLVADARAASIPAAALAGVLDDLAVSLGLHRRSPG